MKTAAKLRAAPAISPWVLRGFTGYARRYVARHFHALRLAQNPGGTACDVGVQTPADRPVIVYLNHSSWWDPLIAMLLAAECFPGRPSFAPMDAQQLERYGIFRKVGVFGVEQGTARGARDFLRMSSAIFTNPSAMLWLTPQARFADVRERPLRFAAGLGSLVRRFPTASFVPLALEYTPWGERLPEVLARFGKVEIGSDLLTQRDHTAAISAHFEEALAQTMDALAADSMRRDASAFSSLLEGSAGVNRAYDFWGRLRAGLRGQSFQAEHRPASAP